MGNKSYRDLLIIVCTLFFAVALVPSAFAFTWPRSLVFGTTAVGTAGHRMTAALAPMLEEETGMKVRVIPEGNEMKRYMNFVKGRINVQAASISEMSLAIAGRSGYADKPRLRVRLLWHQNDTPWMFAAPGNTRLKDIYDIKKTRGVKIALNNSASTHIAATKGGLLDFLQLTENDVVLVPVGSYGASVRSINEGKADIALVSPISGVTHEIASSPIGVKWMDLPLKDVAGWKRFLKHRPTDIPTQVTWGVKSSIGHAGYTSNFLYWVSADTDPEFVYRLSKWIGDKFEKYKKLDKALTRMDVKIWRAFLDHCPAPVHESTIRYLREAGYWSSKDDVWQARAVAQVDAFDKAWKKAIAEGKRKRVSVSRTNQEWLDIWAKHSKGLEGLSARLD